MLKSKGDLAAVQLAFFAPAFLISAFICLRHGFRKQLGWFYITLLSLLRIIGASCTLYIEINNDYTAALLETVAITSSIGLAPLLLALLGFLQRIHSGMQPKGLSHIFFQPIQILSLAALIIFIVGGVDQSHTDSAGDLKTGRQLVEAASILFLFIWLSLAAITGFTMLKVRHVLPGEKRLAYAAAASLPFLLVRLIYTVASGFAHPGTAFYNGNVNVWVQAFMQFSMEAIVVSLYILAGLMTPRADPQASASDASDVERHEQRTKQHPQTSPEMETGYPSPPALEQQYHSQQQQQEYQPQQKPQRYQPPRQAKLGDYRPSRLIMNALRDRN